MGVLPSAGESLTKGSIWISEVLADPSFTDDTEGEFVELCVDTAFSFSDSTTTSLSTITLTIDGKSNQFPLSHLHAGQAFVLCRDSASGLASGIPCQGEWPQLSLANGRALWTQIRVDSSANSLFEAVIPASHSGVSQENQAPSGAPADFVPSRQPFRGGFASPGNCDISHSVAPMSGANPSRPALAEDTVSISTLKTPKLSRPRLSLSNPDGTLLGIPSGFAGGLWKMVTSAGSPLASGSSPPKAAWISFDTLLESQPVIPNGPAILVLEKGSKRWLQALVVVP